MDIRSVVASGVLILLTSAAVDAAAGTSIVAEKGQEAYASPNWPEGVAELVNHPLRTTGWNDWFSEWPNDVNHYAFAATSTADVNRLVAQLAKTAGPVRQVKLTPMAEPRGLGWVTALPEGNSIPVIFSIGDQQRIDQWYGQPGKKQFGVIEFEAPPVAVPPTLTIFGRHDASDLTQLQIPADIEISAGSIPRPFHKWNTVAERADAAAKKEPSTLALVADSPEAKEALEEIQQFLERHARQSAQDDNSQKR